MKEMKKNKNLNAIEQLLPPSYRPISAWNYFWRSVLYCIPVIGWIFMIVHAVADKNRNGRGFARSFLLFIALLIVVFAAAFIMGKL
jgi:hypothetical protein